MLISINSFVWSISRVLLVVFALFHHVQADSKLLVRDGPVTDNDLLGYIGTTYQAIRYEPVCGSLGTSSRFNNPIHMGEKCVAPMEVYSNNTQDTLAIYDLTGIRLKNAVVGSGKELCMCFSLSQAVANGIKADICLYVDGSAQAARWWSVALDSFLASEYRPGASKSLPLCANVDLDQVKAAWSATAFQPTFTERVTTLGSAGLGGGAATTMLTTSTVIQISISTIIPSVVDYTLTSTFTTTDAQGRLTTQTGTTETRLPVVTTTPVGLSQADKIALGVGLGIGIPTVLLMIMGLILQIARRRR